MNLDFFRRRRFDAIYHRNASRIFGLAWKLTGFCEHDAEDLCQETFLRAFQSFHTYEDRDRESAWLSHICVNVYREQYRRRMFFNDRIEPHFRESGAPDCPSGRPDTAAETAELGREVRAAIAGMNPALREVLLLRHLEGYDTRQVSELLDIPENTVRSRLKRARQAVIDGLSPGRGGKNGLQDHSRQIG